MNAAINLLQRYEMLKSENPALRQRDAANLLGVSEAQLVACLPDSQRLHPAYDNLLPALAGLGTLKAITRNHAVVHEKDGRFDNLTLSDKVGLVLNPDGLDLRLFLGHWHSVFAVEQSTPRGALRSLQFYDEFGDAIHKLYLKDNDKLPLWQALIALHASNDTIPLTVSLKETVNSSLPATLDASLFAREWLELKDVHHFHSLLRRHGLSRQQAFRHAPSAHAIALQPDCIETLLRQAAEQALPIMVFVGNRGMVQIHTGTVKRIQRVDEWLNVLDPAFNLHLRDDLVSELWLLRRPTRDGIITSIEALDINGDSLVSFFGKRIEGESELSGWRTLAENLPVQESAHVA